MLIKKVLAESNGNRQTTKLKKIKNLLNERDLKNQLAHLHMVNVSPIEASDLLKDT